MTRTELLPVTFDIETVPLLASLDAPYPREERKHPANYRDSTKIDQWYVDDEAAWKADRVKECSLSPRLGRILCVGFSAPCSDGPAMGTFMAPTEADEPHVIRQTWDLIAAHKGRVVTFNGRTFDCRWLVLRSIALGIVPAMPSLTVGGWFARYRYDLPHVDVRDWLTNWDDRASGSLADWCAFAGVPYTNGHTGAEVYGLFTSGKLSEIAAKCRNDVEATQQLYAKARAVFLSEAAA